MNKFTFKPIFAVALLSLGFAACEDDELEEPKKQVDVTITATLPETYDGLSLVSVTKDSIAITIGDNTFYTDATGSASATVEEGLYNISATVNKSVVGTKEGSNGEYLITFAGTGNVEFSEAKTTASVALQVGRSVFTPYGSISSTVDAIHFAFRDDTISLEGIFSPVLAPGDTRSTSFTYELVSPLKKTETGGNGAGVPVELTGYYSVEENLLIAADTLFPAAFDLTSVTGKKRELEPAVLRAKLYAGSEFLAQKDVPVVMDKVDVQLIGIVPNDDDPVAPNIFPRLIPGSEPPTITVAAPYGGTSGMTLSPSEFKGYFSGDSIRSSLAQSYNIDMEAGTMEIVYFIDAVAVNDNGTNIPASGTASTSTSADNVGTPISAQVSSNIVSIAQFYINRTRTTPAQTPVVNETGTIYFFPYGSTKDDFITYTLKVKTVSAIGIAPLVNDDSQMAALARRFLQGGKYYTYSTNSEGITTEREYNVLVNASFFANLKVSEGPDRIYVINENNAEPLVVIKSSINTIEDNPTIELVTGTAAQKNAAVSIDGGSTYIAAQFVQFTATGKNLLAETPITFKLTPKSNINTTTGEVIDNSKAIDVSTKIYANNNTKQ